MATIEQSSATGVSFALTDEQRELRALAREFAEKEIRPRAAEYDEHSTHPADVIAKAHALGRISFSANSRASARSSRCSSVSAKETPVALDCSIVAISRSRRR